MRRLLKTELWLQQWDQGGLQETVQRICAAGLDGQGVSTKRTVFKCVLMLFRLRFWMKPNFPAVGLVTVQKGGCGLNGVTWLKLWSGLISLITSLLSSWSGMKSVGPLIPADRPVVFGFRSQSTIGRSGSDGYALICQHFECVCIHLLLCWHWNQLTDSAFFHFCLLHYLCIRFWLFIASKT